MIAKLHLVSESRKLHQTRVTTMSFKLPCFSRKKSPTIDLPGFLYDDLQELEIIGHGSFGAVFTARCRVNDALETVVVKKKLGAGYDDGEFVKKNLSLSHQLTSRVGSW